MQLLETVLLTGCSEHISEGLCRILRMTGAARRVIGCDTHDYHPGALLFDACGVIAPADDPAFLGSVADLAERHRVDLVIPVLEVEIARFVREEVTQALGVVPVLLPNAAGLGLQGSINVQLRLTERGPVAFEINPRFSGTVVFRHLLGFEDFCWSLQEARGLPPAVFRGVPSGYRFFLGAQELIIAAAPDGAAIASNGHLAPNLASYTS